MTHMMRLRNVMRRFRPTALLLAGVLAPLGCERPTPPIQPPKPITVSVRKPVSEYVTDFEEFTGRTQAVYDISIRARVTGYLDKVYFKDGAEVKEGDLLIEIDPRPYKAELARAEATLTQSEAHLKRLEADFRRASTLLARGGIGREEYDKIAGDRAEAEAAVGIAAASRDASKLSEEFTRIKSPITGRLSRRLVDPGNLVKADDTILTSIVSLDPLYVYFDVDERTMLELRRLVREGKMPSRDVAEVKILAGLADEVDLEGNQEFPHEGTINFSDNKVEAGTGTLSVRASIENPKTEASTSRVLSPGLFIRVRLPVGSPHKSILVPEQAIGTDQGRKFLYVVNGKEGKDEVGTVDYRPVQVGKLDRGLRVVEKGINPGERVIVSGLQRVRPGAKVQATEVSTPLRAENPGLKKDQSVVTPTVKAG